VSRVIKVTKGDGLDRAGLRAGSDIFVLLEFGSVLSVGLALRSHETMVAKSAFFHHSPHAGRDLRGKGSFQALRKGLD
jgi:hypothetical protein